MVRLMRREPVMEYELRDPSGMAIGQVIEPAGTPRTGRLAETVLLVRTPCRAPEVASAA